MSELSVLIKGIEEKIKQTEENAKNALAQFHGLNGILTGLHASLADAKLLVNAVAPVSNVAEAVDVASEIVNEAQNVLTPSVDNKDVPQYLINS